MPWLGRVLRSERTPVDTGEGSDCRSHPLSWRTQISLIQAPSRFAAWLPPGGPTIRSGGVHQPQSISGISLQQVLHDSIGSDLANLESGFATFADQTSLMA